MEFLTIALHLVLRSSINYDQERRVCRLGFSRHTLTREFYVYPFHDTCSLSDIIKDTSTSHLDLTDFPEDFALFCYVDKQDDFLEISKSGKHFLTPTTHEGQIIREDFLTYLVNYYSSEGICCLLVETNGEEKEA